MDGTGRQRHAAEFRRKPAQGLRGALHEQYIPGLDIGRPQSSDGSPSTPGDGQQIQAVSSAYSEVAGRTPDETRIRERHQFLQFGAFRFGVLPAFMHRSRLFLVPFRRNPIFLFGIRQGFPPFLLLSLACLLRNRSENRFFKFEPQTRQGRRQGFRLRFDDEDIPRQQQSAGVGRKDTEVVANHADDLGIGFFEGLFDLAQGFSGGLALFRDTHLRQIRAGIEAGSEGTLSLRHQPAADQNHQRQAGAGDGKAHGCEIEHGKRPRTGFGAKPGNDQVGWSAD